MSIALIANRGLHKRPGGWSPKELGTLSLWLDADDATTITISTGVSQWDDKSGNSRNVTQGTGSTQPTWVKGAQNGRAVVRFDGTKQVDGGDILDLRTGALTIVAASSTTTTANGIVMSKTSSAINANGEWAFYSSTGEVYMGGVLVSTSATSNTAAAKVGAWVVDRSAGSTFWRNGTQVDTDTASPFPNSDDLNTGTSMLVGGRVANTTGWLNGDVYEIIVSLTALSTSDRQKAEGYLAHKWGLVSNLPSDHPYKSAAP